MANVDRSTLKANYQAVTDRTPPYDAEPLIQKEDQQATIGDDFMDSALVKLPNVGSINSPSAAFNVDFDFSNGIDRYDIDTTGSVDAAFTITLAGLSDNQTGILNIAKKSNDTISFSNGLITPFNNTEGQTGKTSIVLFVKIVNSTYILQTGYSNNAIFNENSEIVRTKIVEIGPWNMDGFSNSFIIPHGLLNSMNIRSIDVMIQNDAQNVINTLYSKEAATTDLSGGISAITNTDIQLVRLAGGVFDNADYNDTNVNRGWVYITYIV